MDKGWGFVRILYHTCCRCVKRLNFLNILVHFIAPLRRGNSQYSGRIRCPRGGGGGGAISPKRGKK